MSSHKMITALSIERADGQYEPLLVPGTRHVESVEGLVGLDVREQVRSRPGRHGVLNTSRYRDSQPVVIVGELFGADADEAWEEYGQVAGALASAVDTDRSLRWSGGTQLELVETKVRLVSMAPPVTVAQDVIRYQLILRPGDPRSFAQTEQSENSGELGAQAGGLEFPVEFPITFTPAGGAVAAFTVGGTDLTPAVFEIHGFCSGPSIVLQSTGEEIVINGSVDAGRYLEVDVDAREVRLDDGTVRNNLFDFAASTWFELPPGPQSIQLFASTFDENAFVRVRYRPAYA